MAAADKMYTDLISVGLWIKGYFAAKASLEEGLEKYRDKQE